MIEKLEFSSDERGVSEVMGAILVFGILIVLLGIIQTQAVPAQNQEVEFKHNQEVQGDFAELQQSVSESVRDGNRRSVSFSLGASYPSRLLFINPPDPSGAVRSTDAQTAEFVAQGGDIQSPEGQVDERIQNVNTPGELSFELRSLVYEPNYNEYQNPPSLVSEYGVMYLNSSDSSVVVEDRAVVDGTTISLVSTAGDFDRSSAATRPLGVDAAPAPTTTVPIQHGTPGPNNFIELTLPTRLGQEQWDSIVSGQSNVVDANVDATANEVTLELRSQDGSGNPIEYELEVPRYEVDNSAPSPSPTYVTFSGGSTKSITPGQPVEVSAEVRDRFNNPIPGQEVEFELVSSGATETVTSDAQGIATAEFPSPPAGSTTTVNVDAASISDPTLGQSSVSVVVVGGNPTGPTAIVVTDTSIDRSNDEVELDLRNDGPQPTEINRIQLEYAVQSLPSGIDTAPDPTTDSNCASGTTLDCPTVEREPEEIREVSAFGVTDTVQAEDGGEPQPVNLGGNQISAGATETVTLKMNPSSINDDDAAVLIHVKVFFQGGYVETYDLAFAERT
ncbi:hypothetical protein BRD07_08555 [Halobacteriales archaeon QS_9_68_42]|nr:MAG: hypothetical protein BRD07_08555 [Halobacteriales archaeon QS_9_68_42]